MATGLSVAQLVFGWLLWFGWLPGGGGRNAVLSFKETQHHFMTICFLYTVLGFLSL